MILPELQKLFVKATNLAESTMPSLMCNEIMVNNVNHTQISIHHSKLKNKGTWQSGIYSKN